MLGITVFRLRKGWSKSELARRAGLNTSTICQVESGRLQPYPAQLLKLSRALGVCDDDQTVLLRDLDPDGLS